MKVLVSSFAHLTFMVCSVCAEGVPEELRLGLASPEFEERENAQENLLEWSGEDNDAGASSVYELYRNSDDPEVRERCYKVLRDLSDIDYLSDGKGYLGIMMGEEMIKLDGDDKPRACLRISFVVKDSPASRAGLREGDLIIAVDGKKWYERGSIDDFMKVIADTKPLEEIVISLKRGEDESIEATAKLGRRPVEDLTGLGNDIEHLDEKAKKSHFRQWLKGLSGK